jgi:Fic family protein
MVYIYKKDINGKKYYYLRLSLLKNGRRITKDISYLGNDISTVKKNLKSISKEYSSDIRKSYKKIHRFLEKNYYLEKIESMNIKSNHCFDYEDLKLLESCKYHFDKIYLKLDDISQKEIMDNFVINFVYNTTSIEGNTIALNQVYDLFNEDALPKSKSLREVYDVKNTKRVFEDFMFSKKKITHKFICDIHKELVKDIDNRVGYRSQDIRVFKSHFDASPGVYVKDDMDLLLKWYNSVKRKLHPFVLAVLFHHKFEKIYPFMDGNGRCGRFLMNFILVSSGYPPVIVLKKNRIDYLNALGSADKANLNDIDIKFYKKLVGFVTSEMIGSYWDYFL